MRIRSRLMSWCWDMVCNRFVQVKTWVLERDLRVDWLVVMWYMLSICFQICFICTALEFSQTRSSHNKVTYIIFAEGDYTSTYPRQRTIHDTGALHHKGAGGISQKLVCTTVSFGINAYMLSTIWLLDMYSRNCPSLISPNHEMASRPR
jgi:hypothetical protein